MNAYGNDPYRARTETTGVAVRPGLRIAGIVAAVVGITGFLVCVGTATAAMISATHHQGEGAPQLDEGLLISSGVALAICIVAVYAMIFLGMGWIYRVWSWLPESERHTRHWKGAITPSTAALFLFIPYFQYYWMFVINCGLCDAMDRMRVGRPTSRPAPKGLAIAAGVCQLLVPMPVGIIMWLVYMGRIETMAREMAATPMPAMPATA